MQKAVVCNSYTVWSEEREQVWKAKLGIQLANPADGYQVHEVAVPPDPDEEWLRELGTGGITLKKFFLLDQKMSFAYFAYVFIYFWYFFAYFLFVFDII